MNRAKLGDLCVLNYGKSLRNYQSELDKELIVRVYGTNGAIGWTNSALCEYPTIIIGRKGAYRGVNFSSSPSWTIDTAYYLTLRNDDIDLKWLYYRLLTVDINSMDTGSAIPSTKREDFYSVSINIPPQISQKRIANILSAYDDLIENNRRRIQLLERSLHLLYKEWFVHLRFPSHEHSKIVDGIPEGWEKVTAFDVMEILNGGTPKTAIADYWDGSIPFFTPKDATSEMYTYETEKFVTEYGLKNCNSKLYPKDTIFITARGTVGKISLAQREMAMNQSCFALVAKEPLNQYFLYFALQERVSQFRSRAVGAVFDSIIRETFKFIPFIVPHPLLIGTFTDYITPIVRQIDNLLIQNRKLKQARDLLLPKLMSGAIGV
jgi:type I restriction enzyme S subunit